MKSEKPSVKVMILDHEDSESFKLSALIQDNFNEVEIYGVFNDGKKAQHAINENTPDILFIKDNTNSGDSALDFLKTLPKGIENNVVYITENEKNALQALRYGVRDFVINPIEPKEIKSVLSGFIARQTAIAEPALNNYRNKIMINKKDRAIILDISNILFMEAEGPYTNFVMHDNSEVKSSKSMGYYLKLLTDMPNLIRVNRSYVVNFDHIKEIVKEDNNAGTLILNNGKSIEFSANVKNRLLQNISELLAQYIRA
jgi:two-component system, LytTR family, response regulator